MHARPIAALTALVIALGAAVAPSLVARAEPPALTITLSDFAHATYQQPYDSLVGSVSGGTGPYAFTLSGLGGGGLPTGLGLTFASDIGRFGFTGTPEETGSYTVTVRAAELYGEGRGSVTVTVVVDPAPLTFSPSSLDLAAGGSPYRTSFVASGSPGPISFAVSEGLLPSGLSLSSAGELSGTATAAGTYSFVISATGPATWGGPASFGSRAYTLVVATPGIYLNAANLSRTLVGVAFEGGFSATGAGGGFTFELVAGTLPPGLTLDPSGTLAGTPTTAGSYSYTIRATDRFGWRASQSFVQRVGVPAAVAGGRFTVLSGSPFEIDLAPTGDPAPTVRATTSLPPGLALSPTGVLTGTLTAPAAVEVTVIAENSYGAASPVTVQLQAMPAPAVPSVEVRAGDGSIRVTPRPGTGGGPVAFYEIYYRQVGATHDLALPSAGETVTISGLANGTTYEVAAMAYNDVASSGELSDRVLVTPGVATIPVDAAVTVGAGSLGISWGAPADDGGVAVTGYRVRWRAQGESTWVTEPVTGPTATSMVLDGLQAGVTYEVELVAINATGPGAAILHSGTPFDLAPEFTSPDGAPLDSRLEPGERLELGIDGLPAGASVVLELHSTPVRLASGTAGPAGGVTLSGTIPASTPAGIHQLVVTVSGAGILTSTRSMTVSVARSATASGGGLASTGREAGSALPFAIVLLLTGGVLVGVRRLPGRKVVAPGE